ncbi:hypothetical protein BD560DRAFT_442954 [Blakeslea trispora]|nr:hypothetical protein BD560DRAFT_442954 [Blakeslea trispora]
MSTIFLFEDGHGNVVDENGGPEPMDYIVDDNEFIVETITTHTEYLNDPPIIESFPSCSMLIQNIFESSEKGGRKCILTEEHNIILIDFIDDNPSTTVIEVTKHLLKRFDHLKVSCSTAYNFIRIECNLSLKKADFHSIERNSLAKIEERPTTRANTISILGAISAAGLITIVAKKPTSAKKRKADGYISSGTVTGHYISFSQTTLDEMDKYPHMKGHYIVMDNAPIHKHENIKK